MQRAKLAFGSAMCLVLAGCGGGGDSTPSPQGSTPLPDAVAITVPANADIAEATSFGNSVASTTTLKFSWDFGDGQTSTEPSPKHSYSKAGEYVVSLKVSNQAGQARETKSTVTVNNLTLVRGLECSAANSGGWCWQAPLPTGNRTYSVSFIDGKTGWRVGAAGDIFKTTDSGASWVRQVSGVSIALLEVKFADSRNGWIRAENGVLLKTQDGGSNWTVVIPNTERPGDSYSRLAVMSANSVRIDGNHYFLLTNDAGKTWTEHDSFGQMQQGLDGAFWVVNGNSVTKASAPGATPRTVLELKHPWSASASWARLSFFNDRVVMVNLSETGSDIAGANWIATHHIWRSEDGGNSWTKLNVSGLPNANGSVLTVLQGGVDGQQILGRVDGKLFRSSDGGSTWRVDAGPPYSESSSGDFKLQAQRLFFLAAGDTELRYSDDVGKSWNGWKLPESLRTGIGNLQSLDASSVVIGDSDSGFFLTPDAGKTWKMLAKGEAAQSDPFTVYFLNARKGFLINRAGELHVTKDGGRSWALKLEGLGRVFDSERHRIQFVSEKSGFFRGSDGRLYRTTDAGESWSSELVAGSGAGQFGFSDESNGWLSNNYGVDGFSITHDGGKSWTHLQGLGQATYLYIGANKTITAVGGNGYIAQSADDGKTWQTRYSGVGALFGKVFSLDGKVLWALMARTPGAARSDDGGTTWSIVLFPVTSRVKDIQFMDAKAGWIVGEDGTALTTNDGGKTWTQQLTGTNRNLFQVHFVDSRTGWIVGEGGTLLATGTGGN